MGVREFGSAWIWAFRPRMSRLTKLRRTAAVVAGAAALGLAALGIAVLLQSSTSESGVLYFTTFRHTALYKVDFDFRGGQPHFGHRSVVVNLPGADGVVFEPNGQALVGGQATGMVEEVNTKTGAIRQVASGCPYAFLLAMGVTQQAVYTAGLPGPLCELRVDPLQSGTALALHGDDTEVSLVAFDDSGRAFYTTGVIPGTGNFGVIDMGTLTTTRELTHIPAHGIVFDAYSRMLYSFGGNTIIQIDPSDPTHVVSALTVPGAQLDNGTSDGHGHVFVASNFGQLVVLQVHRSGDPPTITTVLHLHNDLDDIAPLTGPGAASSAEGWWTGALAAALGLIFLSASAVVLRPLLPQRSRRPRWDLRRREAEDRGRQQPPRPSW